jgi:hypothetical protein
MLAVLNRLSTRESAARSDLLAALERRGLTSYRASRELAWVVFPPAGEGAATLEILHISQLDVYRVVARDARPDTVDPARLLGLFATAEGAADCAASTLLPAPA